MNALGHVSFNLLVNSAFTFALTLAIVYPALRVLRLPGHTARLCLLIAPVLKVTWDMARGVPASSFLWARLSGHAQDLGSFRAGVGLTNYGPVLKLELAAFSGGLIYPMSVGDLIDGALSTRIGSWAPSAIAASVLVVSIVKLGLRALRTHQLRTRVQRSMRKIGMHRLRFRNVAIWLSESYRGVPFASGLFSPRVVFSEHVYAALDPAEREAALQHELAHIARLDLWLLAGTALLSDVFWYLPLLRGLTQRVHSQLELRADADALAAGASAPALASALVSAGAALHEPTLGAAMASDATLLGVRVHKLLGPSQPLRTRRVAGTMQLACIVLSAWTIAGASFCANHHAALIRFANP